MWQTFFLYYHLITVVNNDLHYRFKESKLHEEQR